VTVSQEQIAYGRELCAGLDVDLRYQDYRDVEGRFDRVISVGMFEAVGEKNYRTYMRTVERCLEDDGLFLLHTIGTNTPDLQADPWTVKYIFPGGMLPLQKQIDAATQGIFIMEDWHNIGTDYDPTLMAWMANIDASREQLEQLGYDDIFSPCHFGMGVSGVMFRPISSFPVVRATTFPLKRVHEYFYPKNFLKSLMT